LKIYRQNKFWSKHEIKRKEILAVHFDGGGNSGGSNYKDPNRKKHSAVFDIVVSLLR